MQDFFYVHNLITICNDITVFTTAEMNEHSDKRGHMGQETQAVK